MKKLRLLSLLLLTLVLSGCMSYYGDMHEIANEQTDKAEEVLDMNLDRIGDVNRHLDVEE